MKVQGTMGLDGEKGVIGRGLDWWLSVLAGMVPESIKTAFLPRETIVSFDGERLSGSDLPPGEPVVLSLSASCGLVIATRVLIKPDGQVDLTDLASEISRLTPFAIDRVLYDPVAEGPLEPDGRQAFRIALVSRDLAEKAQSLVMAQGMRCDRLVLEGSGSTGPEFILSGSPSAPLSRGPFIAILLAIVFILSVPLINAGAGLDEARAIRDHSAADLNRIAQVASQAGLQRQDRATQAVEERVARLSASEAMTRLKDLLSGRADLAFLQIKPDRITIEGSTGDAPALLAGLENAGWITAVEFAAPLVSLPEGGSRFQLVLLVSPAEG